MPVPGYPPGHARRPRTAARARRVGRPGLPIDEFPNDVSVASVLGCVSDHPDEDDAQGRIPPVLRPVRHRPRRLQVERGHDAVGMGTGAPVEIGNIFAGLIGLGPHVGALPNRAVFDPWDALRGWATKGFTQVSILQPGQVLDQAEQIRPRRRHRAATIVLTQVFDPPIGAILSANCRWDGTSA